MPAFAPLPLKGVRIADLTWMLASAGATTILASLGAQVIRIEWPARPDFTRFVWRAPEQPIPLGPIKKPDRPPKSMALIPEGRAPNLDGVFNDRNTGKLGITLNMAVPEGRELFKRLVATSDVVIEGFSAPTMGKWGLDHEALKKVKENIIYMQMSGFGNGGPYRDFVSYGPTAQATAGLGYLNGLPDRPPTAWNHSYMDTTPPYYAALAVMSALYYRNRTGKGQYIDQAQYEPGLLLGGTSVIEFSANQHKRSRFGSRSPYIPAAPHGVYRCVGEDAWIGIAIFNDDEWKALCHEMENPEWTKLPEFAALDSRMEHQDELDAHIEEWTTTQEKYDLMYRLQRVGVTAGAVQSPEDKVEDDPQLKARSFFVPLHHSEIGTWPVTRHFTPKLSLTPAHPGGTTDRAAPCMGEDNHYFYETIMGLSPDEIAQYEEKGII